MTSPRRAAWKEIGGRRVPVWVESEDDLALLGPVPESDVGAADLDSLERTRLKLEELRSAPDIDPDRLRVSAISIPEGVASVGPNPEFPARAALVQLEGGWWDKVGAVEFQNPALVRVDPGPGWSRLDADEKAAAMDQLQEILEKRGVKVYGAITSGVSNHVLLKTAMDPTAPSGMEFNLDQAVGDYMPAAMKDSPEQVSATAAGKMMKRDKSDTVGGAHFFTPYPENITDARTVPISGPGGQVNIPYDISDDPAVFSWVDEVGETQWRNMNATDGSGDIDAEVARRIYYVQTGRQAPASLKQIQINWQVREHQLPDGSVTGGTMKALLNMVPHQEYQRMQRERRFNTPMRISSDGLAKELANAEIAHGRTLWHLAKPDQWEWAPASGMTALPALGRRFNLDDLALLHFQHSTEEAFYASVDAETRAVSAADRINAILPRGVDENGTLDPLDDEYMRNVRSEQTVAQKFADNEYALRTGSPYASPGAMDAVAGGASGKLNNLRRRGGGAGEITIPAFKGKRTAAENLPDYDIQPEQGMVRLAEREMRDDNNRRVYAHYLVFNNSDMADPEQLQQQSGPDNDDEYNAVLGRDEKTGRYKVFVWRDPLPPGGGTLYDAHPDDVRRLRDAGYPTIPLRADYETHGQVHPAMDAFLRSGGGMHPEMYDEDEVKRLAWEMADDDPAVAMKAKNHFSSMLLGRGRVSMLSNMSGIAMQSDWIEDAAGWEEWGLDGDSLDVEIFGSGHNERSADQLAEKIVRKVLAGEPVDIGIMSVREGTRDVVGFKYADMRIEEMTAAGERIPRGQRQRFMEEWREIVKERGVRLPKWQAMDQWIEATEAAVEQIENVQMSLANGPQEWLQARRQGTPPPNRRGRNRRWISNDVDEVGRYLSDFWNRTWGQTQAFVQSEFDLQDVRRETSANQAVRQEIRSRYEALAWQRIDREIVEGLELVRAMSSYEDGMLMGSFTQWELNRRAQRNNPQTDDIEERLYAHLRARAFKTFDPQEQEGFYRGTAGRIGSTVVVDYEGSPWARLSRSTGELVDTRRPGIGSPGWVRYRHEGKIRGDTFTGQFGIGPHASTSSSIVADHLLRLSHMGAEFRYLGDLGGRSGRGVFEVRFRQREQMQYTPEQMLAWMEDRFHKGIPDEKLLPMWASLDNMAGTAQEFFSLGGRPATVTSSAVRYGQYDLTQPRTEFPDFEYEVELPPELRRQIPDEAKALPPASEMEPVTPVPSAQATAEDRLKDRLAISASTAGTTRLDPDMNVEDLDLPPNRVTAEETQDLLDDMRRKEPSLNQRRAASQAEARRNTVTYRPTFGFADPSVQPSRVNRVGGRDDSMAILVNLMGEVQEAYGERHLPGTFVPRYDESKFIGKVWQGKMVGPQADRAVDAIWRSPTIGHFTTSRDVARAYRDWIGWYEGKIPALAAPGLRHAKTADEAAALVLKDLYMRAEERFWRNSEIGYMDRQAVTNTETGEIMGYRWKHTRGKTNELRQRVRPMISARVPTPLAGYSVTARVGYTGQRRKILERWFEELEMPEMFDGDPDRWMKATPQQTLDEFTRVYAARDRNMLKLLAIELFQRDNKGFEVLGRRYRPGMVQTADELIDLGVDMRDVYRYFTGLMSDLDDQNLEILARTSIRRGVEAVMESMGLPTVSPEAAATDNPALQRDWDRRSVPIMQDYDKFKSVINATVGHLEAGRWTNAGVSLKSLSSANTVQWAKRHSVIYTQMFGTDLSGRGLGRIIPVASQNLGDLRAAALLDINTLFDDREINNTIEGLKTAVTRQGWDTLHRTNRDLYNAAKTKQRQGDEWTKKNGVRNAVVQRIFDEDYNREWGDRKRGGLNFRIIHRFQWYTMLSQGVGAKFMARAIRRKGIKVRKRAILNRRAGLDWPCWTNANQGWIDNDQEFESGHHQPPFHPGCKCRLQLSTGATDPTMKGLLKPASRPRFININRMARRAQTIDPLDFRLPSDLRVGSIPGVVDVLPY